MTKQEQRDWYKTFDTFRRSRVKYFTPKIYKELIKLIRQAINEPTLQLAISRLDLNLNSQDLATLIQSMYVDAGRIMGGKAYQLVKKQAVKSMMPIGYNEELINEIIAYFQSHLLSEAVLPITQTMKEWIFAKMVEGQQKGMSITQVADEIIKHDFPKNRAILIARTEIIKSANYGARQGAKKAGYACDKQWISASDNRTRRTPRDQFSHLAMNGITIDIDEAFHVPNRNGGYDLLMQPGDPTGQAADLIQCRCCLGFVVKRDANGIPIKG